MLYSHKRLTLFRSTATTVAAALIVFQLIMLATIAYYIILPMAKRSADDLAAIMVLSAQTWVELPPQTRVDFELELAKKHNLRLFDATAELPGHDHRFPYLLLLEDALAARTGESIRIKVTELEQTWLWAEIHTGGKLIRIGFPHNHLGMQPPLALLLVLAATVVLTLITAVILARRITRPLERLSEAARHVGQGNTPEALPENGPEELASLARAFNLMALQVQELLANRTTLLAGISHDLRTPLARMRLALELLKDKPDPKLIDRLERDIDQMNRLIGNVLDLARGLAHEKPVRTVLPDFLRQIAADFSTPASPVTVSCPPCQWDIAPTALQRAIGNLLQNAQRYAPGSPVELVAMLEGQQCRIGVLDRGPGIAPDQLAAVFEPFHRLDASRSPATGGSGLGLAIVRELARANGWQVVLEARPGGGLQAWIELSNEVPGKSL